MQATIRRWNRYLVAVILFYVFCWQAPLLAEEMPVVEGGIDHEYLTVSIEEYKVIFSTADSASEDTSPQYYAAIQ